MTPHIKISDDFLETISNQGAGSIKGLGRNNSSKKDINPYNPNTPYCNNSNYQDQAPSLSSKQSAQKVLPYKFSFKANRNSMSTSVSSKKRIP